MRFRKDIPIENRELLREQLKQYKKDLTLSKEELKDLEEWVSNGRSPYENGDYICFEGGFPVDYINARRLLKEEQKRIMSLSEQEREQETGYFCSVNSTEMDEAVFVADNMDLRYPQEMELPFK